MLQIVKGCMSVVLILCLLGCTSPAKRESMGEYMDSAAITAKVKARLVDGLGSRGFSIQVKTFKDDVQLSGFVDNTSVKKHAGIIAAHTAGVRQVRNDLIIK